MYKIRAPNPSIRLCKEQHQKTGLNTVSKQSGYHSKPFDLSQPILQYTLRKQHKCESLDLDGEVLWQRTTTSFSSTWEKSGTVILQSENL